MERGHGQVVDTVQDPAGKEVPIKRATSSMPSSAPMDVIRDYTRMDVDNDWYIVREYVNKWTSSPSDQI